MGYIIGGILIILAIYLFVVYVLPVIAAGAGIAAGITAAIAGVVGAFSAIKNYIVAIVTEMNFIHWTWENASEPAKRSYFFGPGYVQLGRTISKAFELNAESGRKVSETASNIRGGSGWWGVVRWIVGTLYQVVAYICIYVLGTLLCAVLGLIHGTITTAIMLCCYVIFTIVWILDRLYLLKNKIRSDCPNCHSRYLIPHFKCPQCNVTHKKLVPGPYGIWKHKCECGYKLPSTFFNGRSKLEPHCPDCDSSIVTSSARPIVFQLIGGSKAGKTVYLSAFFHKYFEKLNEKGLTTTITEEYQPYFNELEYWYSGADCPATAQLNSQMYPVLVDSNLSVERQFSIYDIAGEMFDGFTAESEIQQQQFNYCDGLLFMLDPFSSGNLREDRLTSGNDMSDFSNMPVEDVAANFINYLVRTGHAKANARCNIPLSVIIGKADIKEVKRCIGPAKIKSIFEKNPDKYETLEQARDGECRQFLIDIGLSATVDNLETQFPNIHYFPVSAMGHSPDGSEYEPWGVLEPVEWMLPLTDKDFAELLLDAPATV